jgi:nucleoside-diphosphate-sugar epimerase
MRIAITGGRGRVGRAVVSAALAEGHDVVEIDVNAPQPTHDEPPVEALTQVTADVRTYDELERAVRGCTALVHLAAHPSPDHRPAHEVHNDNVTGSYHALTVAANLGMTHVCLASSINAIGGYYSRQPRYDYLPVDERHPTYNEDPYSLSKWIAETQADSFARRYARLTISSLRFHGVVPDLQTYAARVRSRPEDGARHLWGYTSADAAARACLQAVTAEFTGHEVFYVVAPRTVMDVPSRELHRTYLADVPLRRDPTGNQGFFDCTKAEKLLGWRHDDAF